MPASDISRGNVQYGFLVAQSITPGALTASTSQELSFTVPGILATDIISGIVPPALQTAGVVISYGRVTAANTVAIGFGNVTAGTPTPVAGIYTFHICRTGLAASALPTNAT